MRPAGTHVVRALAVMVAVAALAATYWAGYRSGYTAGLIDRGPQRRALVVVRRTKGNPNWTGAHATWFEIRDPRDAAMLAQEELRLKAIGAEYYIAKARVETTVSLEPDPRRVNSHR